MGKSNHEERTIVHDIIDNCGRAVDRAVAVKAVRALCAYFGGQMVYIPAYKPTGKTIGIMRGVLSDAAGDRDANRILEKIMALFGGRPVYFPMEKSAFRQEVAREIYERYDGTKETVSDLSREYGISFTQVYRLWSEGRNNKTRKETQQ
jgi:Mor family transcriptional regulator